MSTAAHVVRTLFLLVYFSAGAASLRVNPIGISSSSSARVPQDCQRRVPARLEVEWLASGKKGLRERWLGSNCTDLPDTDCAPLILETNTTGRGASGELRVWLKATTTLADSCEVLIWTPHDTGLIVSFTDMYLRPPLKPGACIDHVLLFEVTWESTVPLNRLFGTCVTDRKQHLYWTQTGTDVMLHVRLTVGDRDNESIVGYHLHYSTYQATNGSCPSKEQFQCKDGHCIWDALTCDGRQNCLDNSDEFQFSYATCRMGLNYGIEMLGFFASIFATIMILLSLDAVIRFLLYSWRVRRMEYRSANSIRHPGGLSRKDEEAFVQQCIAAPMHPLDRDLALLEERLESLSVQSPPEDASLTEMKEGAPKPILKHGSNHSSPAVSPDSSDSDGSSTEHGEIATTCTLTILADVHLPPPSAAGNKRVIEQDNELLITDVTSEGAASRATMMGAENATKAAPSTSRSPVSPSGQDLSSRTELEQPDGTSSGASSPEAVNVDFITSSDRDSADDVPSKPGGKKRVKLKDIFFRKRNGKRK